MMVLLPWVFTILAVDTQGGLYEYDVARFDTKEACISFLDGTGWKRTQETTKGFRIIQRSCRKVTYGP
jgi:hypothetical protein